MNLPLWLKILIANMTVVIVVLDMVNMKALMGTALYSSTIGQTHLAVLDGY